MQDFHQWLETNHNEGLLQNVALASALGLGALAPNYSQAREPEIPAATEQNPFAQTRRNSENRRKWTTPLMAAGMGLSAAARAAAKRKKV